MTTRRSPEERWDEDGLSDPADPDFEAPPQKAESDPESLAPYSPHPVDAKGETHIELGYD
jgi:hypothetical protein